MASAIPSGERWQTKETYLYGLAKKIKMIESIRANILM
jgi:hypothetical protein